MESIGKVALMLMKFGKSLQKRGSVIMIAYEAYYSDHFGNSFIKIVCEKEEIP